MNLTLPDDIPALREMSECDIRRELALWLYSARKITIIQAADLAASNLFEFQALLRDRHIPQHYGESDLDADLRVLQTLGAS